MNGFGTKGFFFQTCIAFLAIVFSNGGVSAYNYTLPSGTATVPGNVSLSSGDNNFTIASGATATFGGVLSGTGNLVKLQDGVLVLDGANTFTGSTKLQGGTIRLGHDLALASWLASGNSRGLVTISGNGTIQTLADRTLSNRFVVADASSLQFNAAAGTTLTLQNVNSGSTTSDFGGTISTNSLSNASLFTGGGRFVLSGNRSGNGGALGSSSTSADTGFDLTEAASVTFSNNNAVNSNGGAVYAYSTGAGHSSSLRFGNNVTFSGNGAASSGSSGDGGGIYIYSGNGNATIDFGQNTTFTGNTAKRFGGAIYAYAAAAGYRAEIDLGTHSYFQGNTSSAPALLNTGGGAIYSSNDLTVRGNTFFSGNSALSAGGAVYMFGREASTLLLDSTDGDIAFRGNTAAGTPNSIYLAKNTTIQIKGAGNIYMDDPIAGSNAANALNNQLIVGGSGTNVFTGTLQLKGVSQGYNDFSARIDNGRVRLVSNAELRGGGAFTLGTDGTLAGAGTVGFGSQTLSGTIAPDSTSIDIPAFDTSTNTFTSSIGASSDLGTLTFSGSTTFNGAVLDIDTDAGGYDQILVNGDVSFGTSINTIAFFGTVPGTSYDIIVSDRTIAVDPSGKFQVTGVPTGRHATVQWGNSGVLTNNVVQVVFDATGSGNVALTWTGMQTDLWNIDTDENWTDVPGGTPTVTKFADGDRVFFDTDHTLNGRFAVSIPGSPVVADMTVTGSGQYAITGDIVAQTAGTTLTDATGKLVKSGTGTLTLDGNNQFQGGIDITGGTLVAKSVNSVAGGTVTLSNASTLQFDETGADIFSGTVTGTGNLVKSNSGTLTLTGTNDYRGTTTVDGGTLIGNIAGGTDLVVRSGATYQSGGSDRIVATLNGDGAVDMQNENLTVGTGDFSGGVFVSVDQLTKTGPGTFTIGNKSLADGTVSLGSLDVQAGTLEIDRTPDGNILTPKVTVAGTASFEAGSVLSIGRELALSANAVIVENGAILDVCACTGTNITLIHSDAQITNDFEYTIGGVSVRDLNQITIHTFVDDVLIEKQNNDHDIVIVSGRLVWNNTDPDSAHGTFEVGTSFEVSQILGSKSDTGQFYTDPESDQTWDGQTLTKTGAGVLILNPKDAGGNSVANTYLGDTLIRGGAVSVKNAGALGPQGTARISSGASLVLDYNDIGQAFSNEISGVGNLEIASSARIDRANSGLTGSTTIDSGAALDLRNGAGLGTSRVRLDGELDLNYSGRLDNSLQGNGRLDIGAGNTIAIGRVNDGFSGTTRVDGALVLENAAGIGSSALTDEGSVTLGFDGNFANPLDGSGNLIVDGNVTIGRANGSFQGATRINMGKQLTLNNVNGIGNNPATAVDNAGTLVFDLAGSSSSVFSKSINGRGNLVKNGNGTVTLSAANNNDTDFYGGSTTVNAGKLVTDLASNVAVTPCGTDLSVASGAIYQTRTRDQQVRSLTGSGTVDMNASNGTGSKNLSVCSGDFSRGILTGVSALNKNSGGTFILGTLNSAVAQMTLDELNLNGGTLKVALDNQDPTSTNAKILVAGNATFATGTIFSIGRELTLQADNVIIDSGATLDICACPGGGQSDIVLIRSDHSIIGDFTQYTIAGNPISDAVTLDNFITGLEVGINANDDREIILQQPGQLVWNSVIENSAHGTFNVGTEITISQPLEDKPDDGRFFQVNGQPAWDGKTLTKTGNGTLILTGANTYTGGTVINSGTVVAKKSDSLGAADSSVTTADNSNLVLDYDGSFQHQLSGGGDLTINGEINIIRSNPLFTGDTTVTGKTTTLQNADSLGSSNIDVGSGASLVFNTASDGVSGNRVTGEGRFTKNGGGTLTMDRDLELTGGTTVRAGTLVANLASATAALPCGADLDVRAGATFRAKDRAQQVALLTGSGTIDMQGNDLAVCGGDFSGGTFERMATVDKNSANSLLVGGFDASNLNLNAGSLGIKAGETVALSGSATIANDTTLNIGANTALTAAIATIGSGTTLNVQGYNGTDDAVLIDSDALITGDFSAYFVNGHPGDPLLPTSLDRFFNIPGIGKHENGRQIVIEGRGLVWDNTIEDTAHGTFHIDPGTSVTIGVNLNDNPHSDAYFTDPSGNTWDGKTLTKTGDGTLILDGLNGYTGNTIVTGGTVVATNDHSLGDPDSGAAVELNGDRTGLVIDYADDGSFTKDITGNGTVVKSDGHVLDLTGDLSGMTGVFEQKEGTVVMNPKTGILGGSFDQQDGNFVAGNGLVIRGDATFRGGVRPDGVLNVDGDVVFDGADYYVHFYLNETSPLPTADTIHGNRFFLHDSTLHVVDLNKGVIATYLHGATADFTVLQADQPGEIHGDFKDVTGLTSIFRVVHQGLAPGDDTRYIVTLGLASSTPFDVYGRNHNTQEVVDTLNDGLGDPNLTPLLDEIAGMHSDEEIANAVDLLRGTEIVADAQVMALSSPWRSVFNRLSEDDSDRSACDPCTPVLSRRKMKRSAWFEGYYRDDRTSGDGNAVSYRQHRGGMMLGVDSALNRRLTTGVAFGYADPRISSRFGRIEADDYTFGLYGRLRMTDRTYMNAFIGYGRQNFELDRFDFGGRYRASFHGDAMFTSIEFVRPTKWMPSFTLLPLFAVDFQKSWNEGFSETGGKYDQTIAGNDLGQSSLRFGMNSRIRRNERWDLQTRLQYVRLVGGNSKGMIDSRFTAAPNSRSMNLLGVDRGRDWLNVGIGGNWEIGTKKRLVFFCDYDFDCGTNTTAHTGQLGLVSRW